MKTQPPKIAPKSLACLMLVSLCLCHPSPSRAKENCRWLAGDFHNHTFLTDGATPAAEVFSHAFHFGLGWLANSEHGGAYDRGPDGQPWATTAKVIMLGEPPAGKMWRWQSLLHYSFPLVCKARAAHPDKLIIQGYEWNIPAHEHASVGIIDTAEEGGLAIARHEYLFDANDTGATANNYLAANGKRLENDHAKAVAGIAWLEHNYRESAYVVINHPSRQLKYSIGDLRDFNDAGPHVAFGFEGFPGHQKAVSRGYYDQGPFKDASGNDLTGKARTYGGADPMLTKIGGVWDALLGEGRRFYAFANSDFHSPENDFWPGEYTKNHTCVRDHNQDGIYSQRELLAGLRSGNSFIVHGGLISDLRFIAQSRGKMAEMGSTLHADAGSDVTITIRFKSPARNNHGDRVRVDHIDLIAGEMSGKVAKLLADGVTPNPEYAKESNDTTRVIATFTGKDWQPAAKTGSAQKRGAAITARDGWQSVSFQVGKLKHDTYFRLRGTNLGCGVEGETDEDCNPLPDEDLGANNQDKAYADLWFYSNPLFVRLGR